MGDPPHPWLKIASRSGEPPSKFVKEDRLITSHPRHLPVSAIPGYGGYCPQHKFRASITQGESFRIYSNERRQESFRNGFRTVLGSVELRRELPSYKHQENPVRLTHLDYTRHYEISKFYETAQHHRDYYRDLTGNKKKIKYFTLPNTNRDLWRPAYPPSVFFQHHNRAQESTKPDAGWAFSRYASEKSYHGCRDYLGQLQPCYNQDRHPIDSYDKLYLPHTLYGHQ